jgi:hypothetical protein
MVMAVVMVMRGRGKRRSSEHHGQEDGNENLLHGLTVARCELWMHQRVERESNEETPGAG